MQTIDALVTIRCRWTHHGIHVRCMPVQLFLDWILAKSEIRNAVACTDEAIIVGLLQSQKRICVAECSADEADSMQGKWENPLVPFA